MADVINEKELDWTETDTSDGPEQVIEQEQPEEIEEDVQPESEPEEETEESDDDAEQDAEQESDDDTEDESEETEEDEFFFGDEKLESPTSEEDDAESAPQWVKDLRKKSREDAKRIKELEKQLEEKAQAAPVPTGEVKKPSLGDDGIDYDEDIYEQKLTEYYKAKSQQEAAAKSQQEQQEAFIQLHNEKTAQYNERKSQVKVSGYDKAEQIVIDEVPQNIQGAIIHYAEKPEMVVLALGRNPELRKQISQTTDPVQLGRLIGNIEAKVRIAPKAKKKASSTPSVKGNAGGKRASAEDKAFYAAFPDAKIS